MCTVETPRGQILQRNHLVNSQDCELLPHTTRQLETVTRLDVVLDMLSVGSQKVRLCHTPQDN